MKVLVLASLAYSLVNFRGALLREMIAEGHDVVACAPDEDPATIAKLSAMGVRFRQVPMDRTGTNPWRDLRTLRAMVRTIRAEAPDIILAYTQKPIVYGGIAARLAGGGARFFAMVSGLGHVYSEDGPASWTRATLRRLTSLLYRVAVARAAGIFVFNADDADEMRRHGIVGRGRRIVQVPGSGIDTTDFRHVPVPEGAPVFLLIARLMRNKGIGEFVEAAASVRDLYPDARFQILGPHESGPAGFAAEEVETWRARGIEYLGATRDVRPWLAQASVFVLPTWYREGLPRTILEAMATGRPIITTDMPGCRETVVPGENGLLIPPRDAPALAQAMAQLAADPALVRSMGAHSRQLAQQRFRVDKVNAQLLGEMSLTGAPPVPHPRRALSDYRLAERGLAMLTLVAAAPLLLLVAGAVALMLGRPVLFRQRRAGQGGRTFQLVKFRSMSHASTGDGRLLPDAARLTGFSRLLRRSRLDELPELWNIARGEMSFVGPRPLLPETVDAMGERGKRRGAVRPGLTGWAQVNGNALLSDADKLALDLWYIDNRSLARDAKIVLRTLAMLTHGERISDLNIGRAYARTADRRG
ncbi:sugar transferase [Sphingomonas sp. BT-65]|uniref:sugar transferase n=1 Tax=Sphingomonas sp. BT-65 TaxID=2989821 RepID=UPI00223574A4|nr:sugar transferase [Sphingomonas sp. BT-65]MCW4463446.1 sugar transferase [Sphingomonas sp. BT-65]